MPFAPIRAVALCLAVAAATGCAVTGAERDAGPALADDFARSRLVAADFVDVISQLPALAPASTVLATPALDSRFGELLLGALQDAGYDLRIGAGAGDELGYAIDRADGAGAGPGTYTFLVRVGAVRLKRDYAVDDAGIRPASTMFVHGADASAVVIDRARFEPGAPALASAPAAPVERSGAALTGGGGTALRAGPARAPAGPAARSGAAPAAGSVIARAVPVVPRPAARANASEANLYETRRSAFAPVLSGYDELERRVMVFGNDSLVMGADNKRLARRIAARFDPATDLVSLIGCSHGTTALADGNRTLALGRAARVKEELTLAGIDPDLVLEEGCWAGTHFDRMPARGVVVTHRRLASS